MDSQAWHGWRHVEGLVGSGDFDGWMSSIPGIVEEFVSASIIEYFERMSHEHIS